MKQHHFQRLVLAVLVITLAAAPARAATMTSAEKESRYLSAILNLETYIESYGQGGINLTGVEEAFSGLGRYEQSAALLSYTRILEKLQSDTYDYELMLQLQMLDKDTKFKGYLADTLKGSAIGSVEELTLYVSGRENEFNRQLEAALADYEKCLSFFDANIRYFSLQSGRDKDAYERAKALLAAGDFAGAYYAFSQTNRYQDSESCRAGIADMIGYVPQSETDNPEPVTGAAAECKATEVKLTWAEAGHATGYQLACRQKGEEQWHTTDCDPITAYTFFGLIPDTDYEFSVTALAGRVKTEALIVEARTLKLFTPTPTIVPAPTPDPAGDIGPVKKGSYITFGHYPQTDSGDDKTPVEWLVLDKQDNKALVISRYALDAKPYHDINEDTTWENCTLRAWLNNKFYRTAFNRSERSAVLLTPVDNSVDQGIYGTDNGNDTSDKIFLLSHAEAKKYFHSDSARRCQTTPYAESQAIYTYHGIVNERKEYAWWWLRSLGSSNKWGGRVQDDGRIDGDYYVDYAGFSVRPAMWIDLTLFNALASKAGATQPAVTPTPTPVAKPLKIADIQYYGRINEPGQVEVEYSGGVRPIRAVAYHYFNSSHNAGITTCFEAEGYESGDRLCFSGLVPTFRYWIRLTDAQGQTVWREYTVPDAGDPQVKKRLTALYELPDFKAKADPEDIFFYSYDDRKDRNMNSFTAEKILDRLPDVKIRLITQTFRDMMSAEVYYFWALVLPDGDVYDCGGDSEYVYPEGGEKFIYLPVRWEDISEVYGGIPRGSYTFVFGFHDSILIKKTFTIQ